MVASPIFAFFGFTRHLLFGFELCMVNCAVTDYFIMDKRPGSLWRSLLLPVMLYFPFCFLLPRASRGALGGGGNCLGLGVHGSGELP